MTLKRKAEYEKSVARTREKRMRWWREARYGMFVHWGLYALLERNEWVQAIECIPVKEYEKLAQKFKPKPNAAREWAKLARDAGMKYMVMTTKHHEGFCLWDTQQTNYNSVKTACGRDLVREYVDACREFGLKIGFYYSLMDWHHPDGGRCAYDPEARRRFLDFTTGCVRELMSNYGKIDILWYDVALPFKSYEGWESLAMNQTARGLQPHIMINDRSRLDEDFSTPEGSVSPAESGRGWEACMTFNDTSWGYMPAAAQDRWTDRDILKMLCTASGGCGNLLLNIGPAPDGSVPEEAVAPLKNVGKWLAKNGQAVYGKVDPAPSNFGASASGAFSRTGKRIYFWVRCWPGREMGIGGFKTKLKSARFHVGGEKIDFEQDGARIILKNMPRTSPDKIAGVTMIELEFAAVPKHQAFATTPPLLEGF
ncbi:MAG: alpha-L-fucosidase [Verrucomicrobia bacterium]|nr:alpha-L-fucosidase [Verrucomicrobiota bacterium]MDA1085978.1 alpha-L-fucosidase [Verrucomicrobiota bacterium]